MAEWSCLEFFRVVKKMPSGFFPGLLIGLSSSKFFFVEFIIILLAPTLSLMLFCCNLVLVWCCSLYGMCCTVYFYFYKLLWLITNRCGGTTKIVMSVWMCLRMCGVWSGYYLGIILYDNLRRSKAMKIQGGSF